MKTYRVTEFYNTTKEPNKIGFVRLAQKQDDAVLEFFRNHPFDAFTPASVHRRVFTEATPITSVRRSITNLEKGDMLIKTDQKEVEQFGRPNYKWRLKHREYSQPTLF